MSVLIAAAWVSLGVALWLRALRLYGPRRDFAGDVALTPVPRLIVHCLFAPLIAVGATLVAVVEWSERMDERLIRFAEWYRARPEPEEEV